jgi:hypothetical protein
MVTDVDEGGGRGDVVEEQVEGAARLLGLFACVRRSLYVR